MKGMEELGIGRPSTYAPTISTIINRNYVVKEEREGVERNYEQVTLNGGEVSAKELTERLLKGRRISCFPLILVWL